ncbi:MAG: cytochrome d ubiquinol oxidase subunit II [Spartobacteria bacterium AMD-G4]|nr:MAG: cytochrome d ubiquinol oxidase subunit II [Spartobacteria bacterium AMD-G4]
MDLNIVWYILVGVLFTGYAVLDGFDLGVGALHLFVKKDEHRRLMLNSIGPVWDGNEVWLVTGGGALFAAFPEAYATVFSGFYLAFMLLLVCLIFRAVAIEFRSKEPWVWWRRTWDFAFSISSILSSFLIGIAMGNLVRGIPLGSDREYQGTFFDLLNPYSLFFGCTTVLLFAMHGAIYVSMKTEGDLQNLVRGWIPRLIGVFLAFYFLFNLYTIVDAEWVLSTVRAKPWVFAVVAMNVLIVLNIPREISKGREFYAFLSSCIGMCLMMMTFGLTYFPYMVRSNPILENSLTIYNAASSQKTLGIMLIIAVIGVPIVLAYTASIYWIFRGKTTLTKHSY